jgi:hypothetical protein
VETVHTRTHNGVNEVLTETIDGGDPVSPDYDGKDNLTESRTFHVLFNTVNTNSSPNCTE